MMNSKNSRNLSLEVGKSVFFGHYHQEWPKESYPQPIEWIVISIKKGSALLLSKHILERMPLTMLYPVKCGLAVPCANG